MTRFDEDVVIVGSGFGGSVAALRLAEKGYRVRVYEAGRRFEDDDFAKTSWNLRRYLWAPMLGCYGVQRIHRLPHVMILAGAGVGGGSLNYANTLYQPGPAFFQDPQWRGIAEWESELSPHYATAKRMLGVVEHYPHTGPVERIMAGAADDLGVGSTFRRAPVGVWFGKPGERTTDPFFGGEGPDRTGCTLCGNCMVGCRVGAKNTLMKNYLALAERRGVSIEALRTVSEVRELPGGGFAVTTQRSGAWFRHGRRTVTAEQVVLAGGTWGTQQLLHRMKASGALPRVSDALGRLTRTNSEALDGAGGDRGSGVSGAGAGNRDHHLLPRRRPHSCGERALRSRLEPDGCARDRSRAGRPWSGHTTGQPHQTSAPIAGAAVPSREPPPVERTGNHRARDADRRQLAHPVPATPLRPTRDDQCTGTR